MPTALEEALARVDQLNEQQRNVARRRRNFLRQVTRRKLSQPPKLEKEGLLDRALPDEIVTLAARQIGSAVKNIPGGIVELGKAGVLDVRDLATQGDVTPERLGGIGEAMARQVVEDVRHPLRNPGYLLMDIATLGPGAAGIAGRVGRAAGKYRALRTGRALPDEPPPLYGLPEGRQPKPPYPGPPKTTGPAGTARRKPVPERTPEPQPVGAGRFKPGSPKQKAAFDEEKGLWKPRGGALETDVVDATGKSVRLAFVPMAGRGYALNVHEIVPYVPKGKKRAIGDTTGDVIARRIFGPDEANVGLEAALTHAIEVRSGRRYAHDFSGAEKVVKPDSAVAATAQTPRYIEDMGDFPLRDVPTEQLRAAAVKAGSEAVFKERDRLLGALRSRKGELDLPSMEVRAERGAILDEALAELRKADRQNLRQKRKGTALKGGGYRTTAHEVETFVAPPTPLAAPKIGKKPKLAAKDVHTSRLAHSGLSREALQKELIRVKGWRTRAQKKGESIEAQDLRIRALERLIPAAAPKAVGKKPVTTPKGKKRPFTIEVTDDAGKIVQTVEARAYTAGEAAVIARAKVKPEYQKYMDEARRPKGGVSKKRASQGGLTATPKAAAPKAAPKKAAPKSEPVSRVREDGSIVRKSKAENWWERPLSEMDNGQLAKAGGVTVKELEAEIKRTDNLIKKRKLQKKGAGALPERKALAQTRLQALRGKDPAFKEQQLAKAQKVADKMEKDGVKVTAERIRDATGVSHGVAKRVASERRGSTGLDKMAKPTARDTGRNPRALGISKSQVERALPEMVGRSEAASVIANDLMRLYRENNFVPKQRQIAAVFTEHLGTDIGRAAYRRHRDVKGGSGPVGVIQALKESARELRRPNRGGTLLLGYATRRKGMPEGKFKTFTWAGKGKPSRRELGRKQQVVPVVVSLSNNPLIRRLQERRYEWMSREAADGIRQLPQSIATLGGRSKVKLPDGSVQTVSRGLERHIEFQIRELDRMANSLETGLKFRESNLATIRDKKKMATQIREAFQKAGEEARARRTAPKVRGESTFTKVGRAADTVNQLATIGVLYLKPAYLTANLLGQAFFVMADHYMNPIRVARSAALHHQVLKAHPDVMQVVRSMMGEGLTLDIKGGMTGRVGTRISASHAVMSRASNRVLDQWWREMAFLNEARRAGFTKPHEIRNLVLNENNRGYLLDVTKRANRNMVDYGRMSKAEREVVRRIIFFYPWVKGSSLYTLRFVAEHPGQALILQQSAREAETRYKKILGPVPSYLEGLIPVGERKDPEGRRVVKAINPTAAGVFGSLGDVLGIGAGLLTGNVLKSEQPTQLFSPGVTLPLSMALRRDLFTGEQFPATMSGLEIGMQEAQQLISPLEALRGIRRAEQYESGERSTDRVLFPYTRGERAGRYVGGVTPFGVNPREARSRAADEQRSLRDATQRVFSKYSDERSEMLEAAVKVGLLKSGADLPKALRDAYALRAQRDANIESFKVEKGAELTTSERMYADLSLIVRQGRMTEDNAQKLLERVALLPDPAIDYVARKVRERFFAVPIISRYRKVINARLAARGEPLLSG